MIARSFQCFCLPHMLTLAENKSVNKQNLRKRGRKPTKGPSVFSKNLKTLMAEKGLSSREIGRICGVAPSVVSQWLAGSSPSDALAVLKLCQKTGADFQFLMTGLSSLLGKPGRLNEIFDVEDAIDFSGIFLIEAKRLRWKK
jgi:transcriptional regulator with XRE-family HTH domain